MPDLFAEVVTMREQIAEVTRELAYRRRVYPRWVAQRKVSADVAEYHTRAMEAVLRTLEKLPHE